ncbi:hypothetical protein TSUD_23790 [Trifolium subterraneum]|uniref:HP domain-containing protein n=1 Tax=Trifolium subterraneum TaxID=3900 RepID=A0A2Z6MFQ6_TRISU|nr:hypothetical protein TSUD_23790 [Trifolium subterraneum]
MSSATKVWDPAFQGAGQRLGTEIWRIENFQPVPLPKSEYGKFYMGDSYIILQTTQGKGGAYYYDLHFWIGKDTSQDEAGTAAIKAVELDAALGGRAVQHREIQGHESDNFLSYFRPCIVPLEGGVASGFRKPEEEEFVTRLYVCRGKRVVRMRQIPFARSSLNHDDVFILDTQNKIYQFNGANSSIQERAMALEVVQFLKEEYHEGKCDVAIVDDGKLDTESDSGEFWVLFGGFAPISKKVISEDDVIPEAISAQLYSIIDGEVKSVEGELSKSLLENNKCYLLDCGSELYIWFGRVTQVEERKAACQAADEFVSSQNRPKSTKITRITQGHETRSFKSNFDSWSSGSAEGGKMEVWQINGDDKTSLPNEDIGKFHSGDCYIVMYTYHSGERKEDYFLCCWFGKDSVEEDQTTALQLTNTMSNSLKGRPVQGRIYEGKESPQFVALFQPMVVLKGGLSTGYKTFITDKGLSDETYTEKSIALIRISGTAIHNNKAVQVDAVPSSLNSTECFVLQTSSTIFTWHGNQCSHEQQQQAAKVAEFLRPGVASKHAKEGTENSAFWLALGGEKQSYSSKKVINEVEEIYNFSQDDLLTEDIHVLDTHAEVFLWIGQSVDPKDKQDAFEIGQKYIDMTASLEGLSPRVPLYKITEGNEPFFFTTYFSWDWDYTRAKILGNSFQKKVSIFFTIGHDLEDKSNESSGGGPRQRAEALAALTSAFNSSSEKTTSMTHERLNELIQGGPRQRAEALAALNSAFKSSSVTKKVTPRPSAKGQGSQRAAAVAALSSVLTAENKQSPDASPVAPRSPIPEETEMDEATEAKETEDVSESEHENVEDGNNDQSSQITFSYDELKTTSGNNVSGIDHKRREAYLSDEEFLTVFGMVKEDFYKLPRWKQEMLKKKLELF